MKRWLGMHRYALQIALRRLLAQPFSTLSNLLVVALSLSVPILGAAVLQAAQPLVRSISSLPEITLFLPLDAGAGAADALAGRLRSEHAHAVDSVRVVSAQQAFEALQANPDWKDALAALPDNPLPDSVIVTLKQAPMLQVDEAGVQSSADALVQAWQQWKEVAHVQHDRQWMQRLQGIVDFVRTGVRLLALGVAMVVLATVFNTVRMQALAQREEIAIARLVGATQAFVRRPFLYLGVLTGLLATLTAIVLSALALLALNQTLAHLAQSYGVQLSLRLPQADSLALAALGVCLLGALSARWSVTRTTRF